MLIGLNTALALGAGLGFTVFGTGLTLLDVVGLLVVAVMVVLLVGRARRNLRELAEDEPPAPRGPSLRAPRGSRRASRRGLARPSASS